MSEEEFTMAKLAETGAPAPGANLSMAERLQETSVEERKKLIQQTSLVKHTRKIAARTAVSGIENLDSIFGILQQVSLLLVAEFARRGDWLNVVFFTTGIIVSYLLKIRMPEGNITRFAKLNADRIKGKLIDLSTTIIKK